MIKIRLRPGEQTDSAMRRLRKICEKEGVMKEYKKHQFYEKPSDKRRRELRKAKKRAQEASGNDVPVETRKTEKRFAPRSFSS